MKYIWQATLRTGAIWLISINTIAMIAWLVFEAKVLQWVAFAVDTRNIEYVYWVVGGIATMTAIEVVQGLCHMSRHMIFTSLNNQINDKVLDADVALFLEASPGKIVTIGESLWSICLINEHGLALIRQAGAVLINAYMVIHMAPNLALPVIITGVVLAIALYLLNKGYDAIDTACQKIRRERNVESDEMINGFMEVRTFSGAKEAHRKSIHSQNQTMLRKLFLRRLCDIGISLFKWMGSGVLTVLALLFGLHAVDIGLLENASVVTLIVYVLRLDGPFTQLIFGWSSISEIRAKLPDFNKLMAYEPKVIDGKLELDQFNDSIELKNVSFGYDKASTVIDNVNMTIKKGQHVGICGTSGGGKTTLLKLLNRFYDVDSGSILIDGIDIRQFKLDSLRKHFGCVHQDVFIFAGTLRDNIAYALKPAIVDDEHIIEACKKAGLWGFVKTLPEGLSTTVGNRGLKLSGGQQQRVALARLFLVNPEIIILDEATSSLDNETEAIIQQALDMFHDKTIISVAHRLTTIRNSDVIYVFYNHKIAEFGTHEELMALEGMYSKMVNATKKA